jgi:hypothetical protein
MSYKRNQVEEAIARIFFPNCEKPASELRSRIKRLLDLDRSIGRKRYFGAMLATGLVIAAGTYVIFEKPTTNF